MQKDFLGSSKEAIDKTWPGLDWLRRIVTTRSSSVLGQIDGEYLQARNKKSARP